MELKLKQRKTNSNKQKVLFCIVALVLLFVGIGYAYVRTVLKVGGNITFAEEIKAKREVKILGQDMIAYMDNMKSPFVTAETGIAFGSDPGLTNGQGLYVRAGTEEDEYPIYYFRGIDNNKDGIEENLYNNVLFANKCWKIVRTTETGGTKLIYNGVPDDTNEKGVCANLEGAKAIGNSRYNYNATSLTDVGYMYGTRYEGHSKSKGTYIYGNSVIYNSGTYTLQNTKEVTADEEISNYHYTCFLNSVTCEKVNYVYYSYSSSSLLYYIELANGKTVETALEEMIGSLSNVEDSAIKTYIDNWYSGVNGISSYDNFLEDAVWCNDRSIRTLNGWNPNGGNISSSWYFGGTKMSTLKNSETCPNKSDRFTVNDTINGNGKLDYKIALITEEEAEISGYTTNYYSGLNSQWYWTMSPMRYTNLCADSYAMISSSDPRDPCLDNIFGVRPSISLKEGTTAIRGTGTVSDPYIVTDPITYTAYLRYDANGGFDEPTTQIQQSTTMPIYFTISLKHPTRSGYTFLGWADSPTATQVDYAVGSTVAIPRGDKTLYAVWKQIVS